MPYCMRAHLLKYQTGTFALELLLTPEEFAWLGQQTHTLYAAATYTSLLLARAIRDPVLLANTQEHLSEIVVNCGICERIAASPIPVAYTRCAPITLVCTA